MAKPEGSGTFGILTSQAMPANANTQSSLYAGPVPQPVNHAH